jgi:hypothetical protein
MLFVLPRQPKVQPRMGLTQLREVWTKTFNSSAAQKMTFKKMTLK